MTENSTKPKTITDVFNSYKEATWVHGDCFYKIFDDLKSLLLDKKRELEEEKIAYRELSLALNVDYNNSEYRCLSKQIKQLDELYGAKLEESSGATSDEE